MSFDMPHETEPEQGEYEAWCAERDDYEARKAENEMDAAQKEIDRLERLLDSSRAEIDKLRQQLVDCTRERDKLRAACEAAVRELESDDIPITVATYDLLRFATANERPPVAESDL